MPRRGAELFSTLDAIDFFVYSRAVASAADVEDDRSLNEEHWSYMDRFADGMVARGPTLGADRATWTGSLHIVDLPSAEAAREFVEREPYNRAGLFEQHLIRRFKNLLGRTMWEFRGRPADPRFLVIAHVLAGSGKHASAVPLPDLTSLAGERLIFHGELGTADEAMPVGAALALQAPTRQEVEAVLKQAQPRLAEHFDLEILDWEFGGRR